MNEVKKNFSKWMYWFLLAVAIILVYKFLDNFTAIGNAIGKFVGIISPFLAGTLMAYLLYIPASRIEKKLLKSKKKFFKKRARGLSVFITFTFTILLIILLVNVILPVVTESIVELVNNFQNYWNTTISKLNELPEDSILKDETVLNAIKGIGEVDIKQYLNFEKLTEYAKGAINVVNSIFDVFVSLIVSVYLLAERRKILEFFKRLTSALFKKDKYELIAKYFNKSNEVFFSFISGQVLDAIVVGILTSIAMSVIGVKYSVLLGFLIGLFNLIPYFGAIIAVTVAILITIFTGGIGQAIVMAIVVIILQQIDANIINPKIIGGSLSISPLLVIFSVTVGGAYFGVLGMFLAVPIFTVIKLLIEEYIEYKSSTI